MTGNRKFTYILNTVLIYLLSFIAQIIVTYILFSLINRYLIKLGEFNIFYIFIIIFIPIFFIIIINIKIISIISFLFYFSVFIYFLFFKKSIYASEMGYELYFTIIDISNGFVSGIIALYFFCYLFLNKRE
ncbi:hypothetical protein [Bartonella sp. HY038]|uniref:hypothetical protein n=1 Tax=Bartonella sp. HY038 TaxID=2759660 RepID=UPI0015F872CC|nr:hypothetical protein [Bartonella sp. HY038]